MAPFIHLIKYPSDHFDSFIGLPLGFTTISKVLHTLGHHTVPLRKLGQFTLLFEAVY